MKITDLQPDNRNANKGTKRGRTAVAKSLQHFGAGRSVLIDKDGRIIAGNKTIEQASAVGIHDVIVVPTDGTQIIAVQRTDISLDDPVGRGLAIADNRTAELGLEWDGGTLAEFSEAIDLKPFFTDEELDKLTGRSRSETPERLYSEDQIVDAAFEHFRATGFPYHKLPLHVMMQQLNQLAATETDSLIQTNVANQIADVYNPHRFHASAKGMKAPFDAFADDKLLRRALSLELGTGGIGDGYFGALNIVSGTQSCSNFRPGFASYLYRKYCKKGDTVLDTSTGYGGRLVGFIASGIAGKYIGIDPNVPTHQGNTMLARDLGFADAVELHNLPAEDVPHEIVAGRCDFAFTSPPYFCKEIYSEDDTQSCNRYKSGEAWRDGFLVPMLRLQFAALKPGSTNIVNIAAVKIGDPMKVVLDDDTANSLTSVTVGTDVSETDPTLTSKLLQVDTYTTGAIKVDNGLLNDSGFDIESWVRDRFAQRFFRGASNLIFNGDGGNVASFASAYTAGLTSASAGVLKYLDFATAIGTLDPAYQPNAVWAVNTATLGYIAGLTDSNNRPLFLPNYGSADQGFAGSILGKPVKLITQMPNVAASNVAVYYGDFKKAYRFRQQNPGLAVIRLNERYAASFETGFVGFARVGGIAISPNTSNPAVIAITIHA